MFLFKFRLYFNGFKKYLVEKKLKVPTIGPVLK